MVYFFEGIALRGPRDVAFMIGILVIGPDLGAPEDRRYWLGSVVSIAGVALALCGAFSILRPLA